MNRLYANFCHKHNCFPGKFQTCSHDIETRWVILNGTCIKQIICSICYVSGYENIPQQTSLKQLKIFQSMDKSSSHNFSWAVSGSKHFCLNVMCIFRCWQQFSTYNLFANLHTDLLLVETSKLRKKQAKMNFGVRWRMMGWEEFIHKILEILASSSCYVAAFDLLSHGCDPRPAMESNSLCQGWEVCHMQCHSCCCFCRVTSFSRCLRKAQLARE